MSGTSMDGIDIAITAFSGSADFRLIAAKKFAFPNKLHHQLQTLTKDQKYYLKTFGKADIALGKLIGQSINQLLASQNLTAAEVIAIGNHGQTILHDPDSDLPFSLQIGNANVITEMTGITTVADFRQRDITAGGQGAPLVPAFHQALFSDHEQDRIIVNIGGISNLTLLPALSTKPVVGFDVGPGNILIDHWAQLNLKAPYDNNGQWAATGCSNDELLTILLDEPYFKRKIPKSTGRELFNQGWLDNKLAIYKKDIAAADVQATLTELTAQGIASDIKTHATKASHSVFICGGGAHNSYLLQRLQILLKSRQVMTTNLLGLHPDWVEACAFAWLAYRTINRKPSNLQAATGAKHPTILGAIYPSNNAS